MLTKYKDLHLENLRTSMMVKTPIFHDGAKINNAVGQHWDDIGKYVLGLHDVRSRLGTFTNPWGAASSELFATPTIRPVEDKLSDLLNQRACDLLSLSAHQNRRIAIMWSGGIDSTCMLSSFIKNSNTPDQLLVCCNQASVKENPEFYKNHILGQIECIDVADLDVTDELFKSHILLHGDPGDCIYGPSMPMYSELLPDQQHLRPWRDHKHLLVNGIIQKGASPEFANWYADKVSDNIEEVGMYNIHSIADWWWWHYFNLKWGFSILRPFYGLRKDRRPTLTCEALQSYVETTFYNTEYFQNWSYTNLHRLCRDPAQHKIDAKSYIFELDKNEEYFINKRKVESLPVDLIGYPTYLDQNLKPYFLTDPGVKEALVELLEQYRG